MREAFRVSKFANYSGYQGKFKWFINDMADKLNAIFLDLKVFKEKQLVRMQDNNADSDEGDRGSRLMVISVPGSM
jgi:hypothetical protein